MFPRLTKILPILALAASLTAISLLATPAFAADGPYTVSDVHVDATGASPAEAANAAMAQGRPKAWQILYRRLTRQQDWGRQPDLDNAALIRILRDSSIANERRSTTRYVADVTYTFNPEAVNRLLQGANIAFTQGAARRILLVPMSPNFQIGPWAQALNAPGLKSSVVPFAVAENADAGTLGSLSFDAASWDNVAAAARRVGASEAALVQVVNAGGKLTVNIRRIGPGEAPVKSSLDVPLQQSAAATYASAASAAIGAIEDMWKTRAAIDFSQRGRLLVNVRMASLAQWGAIQNALAAADDVTGVTVNAMDIGYAQIAIAYTGSQAQLRDTLGGAGLALTPVRGGAWNLAMNGGDQ
jgi:hypothetical protein